MDSHPIIIILLALYLSSLEFGISCLPLNFRFSPRFDYSDRKQVQPRSVKSARPTHSGARIHKTPWNNQQTFLSAKRAFQRRHPRSVEEDIDVRITQLKAKLEKLKSHQIQAADVNLEFDEGIKSDLVKAKNTSQESEDDGKKKVNWAEKLHNKHIFSREIRIIGEFPAQFPPESHLLTTPAHDSGEATTLHHKQSLQTLVPGGSGSFREPEEPPNNPPILADATRPLLTEDAIGPQLVELGVVSHSGKLESSSRKRAWAQPKNYAVKYDNPGKRHRIVSVDAA